MPRGLDARHRLHRWARIRRGPSVRRRPAAPDTCRIRCCTRSTSRVTPRAIPDIPAEIRGTYAGLAHPAAIAHLQRLGVTAVELLPVHQNVPEAFLIERGLTNYWGYNTIGFFAPHPDYSASVRAGRPGGQLTEFQDMVAGAARCRHRGHPRCRLQPHHRGRTRRADVLAARAGQCCLLPSRPERTGCIRRHIRVRQCAERRKPGMPAIDHGFTALLGDGDGRRRLPLRSRTHAGPSGGWVRHRRGVLRSGVAGPGAGPGQAHRGAMGRRAGRQLRRRAFPGRLGGVERQVPGHGARLLAQSRRPAARSGDPDRQAPRTCTPSTGGGRTRRSTW